MSIFVVDCQDNDSYAFRAEPHLSANTRIHQHILPDMSGAPRKSVRRCVKCGEILDKWTAPLTDVVMTRRRLDISTTYDGVVVVSRKFKSLYQTGRLDGLEFCQLPDDTEFFAIQAVRAFEFDSEAANTRFIKLCEKCGRFESVVGDSPLRLEAGTVIGDAEFLRSDLEFGSGDEKHPLLICGQGAARSLKSGKLKGLVLTPA